MPTVDTVTISYSRKVQLEQFEPVEHFAEVEVTLDEDDDPDEVYDDHADQVEDMVERSIARRVTTQKLESGDDED